MEIRLRNMTSLYLVSDSAVLCLYRIGSRVADRMYIGSAGGHFEPDELNDPLKCVLREAREELGIDPQELDGLKLRYITHRLKNGEIRQNYYYFARLKTQRPLDSTEGRLKWIRYEDMPSLEMPVSAKQMMLHYLREGRFTDCLYAGITEEEGTRFTVMREF